MRKLLWIGLVLLVGGGLVATLGGVERARRAPQRLTARVLALWAEEVVLDHGRALAVTAARLEALTARPTEVLERALGEVAGAYPGLAGLAVLDATGNVLAVLAGEPRGLVAGAPDPHADRRQALAARGSRHAVAQGGVVVLGARAGELAVVAELAPAAFAPALDAIARSAPVALEVRGASPLPDGAQPPTALPVWAEAQDGVQVGIGGEFAGTPLAMVALGLVVAALGAGAVGAWFVLERRATRRESPRDTLTSSP